MMTALNQSRDIEAWDKSKNMVPKGPLVCQLIQGIKQ